MAAEEAVRPEGSVRFVAVEVGSRAVDEVVAGHDRR